MQDFRLSWEHVFILYPGDFFGKILFAWKNHWKRHRDRGRKRLRDQKIEIQSKSKRENPLLICSFIDGCNGYDWVRLKPGVRSFSRSPIQVNLWFFFQVISRELGGNWSGQEMDWHPFGMLTSQAVAPSTGLQCLLHNVYFHRPFEKLMSLLKNISNLTFYLVLVMVLNQFEVEMVAHTLSVL